MSSDPRMTTTPPSKPTEPPPPKKPTEQPDPRKG
jgi:hypothetical protein